MFGDCEDLICHEMLGSYFCHTIIIAVSAGLWYWDVIKLEWRWNGNDVYAEGYDKLFPTSVLARHSCVCA
jgi:hypothetical protein